MATKKRNGASPRLTLVASNGVAKQRTASRQRPSVSVTGLPTRIYFSRASSTPTGGSLTVLRNYADWLFGSRTRRLFVVGHANLRLNAAPAAALADARCRAVRDLLIWLGARRDQVRRITPSRVHTIFAGSTRGLRASHRSVEILVEPGDSPLAQAASPPRRRSRAAASA